MHAPMENSCPLPPFGGIVLQTHLPTHFWEELGKGGSDDAVLLVQPGVGG